MKEYTPYYRVSTQEQASSGLGFAVQREAVLRCVNKSGHKTILILCPYEREKTTKSAS